MEVSMRIAKFIGYILEVICFIGAYAAHYFTYSRMGMVRHMYYLNSQWENNLPLESVKIGLLTIIALVFIILLVRIIKGLQTNRIRMIVSLILLSFTWIFIILNNTASNTAYYLICLLLIFGSFIDISQNYLYLKKR